MEGEVSPHPPLINIGYPMTTKTVTTVKTVARVTGDDLAREYRDIMAEEKEIAERKAEVKERVLDLMGRKSALPTAYGTFSLEERKSYTWSLGAIKDFFGSGYTAFIKADDKLVKAKMETEPALEKIADVKIVAALTLR